MCGIIHVKRRDGKPAKKTILKRFEKQRSRGTDGFGYIAIDDGYVTDYVRTRTEKEIKERLNACESSEIMFHHRIPTSTPNLEEANHPIKVSHKDFKHDYYVIHNGIVTNSEELKEKHEKMGFVYQTSIIQKYITSGKTYLADESFNDSEAMAIDFALTIEKLQPKMESDGSIALIALQVDKKTNKINKLFCGRNLGNPLCFEFSNTLFSLSSETGESIESDTLYCFDYETGKIEEQKMNIGSYEYPRTSSLLNGWDDNGYQYPMGYKTLGDEEDMLVDEMEELEYLEGEYRLAEQESNFEEVEQLGAEIEALKWEIKEKKRKRERMPF